MEKKIKISNESDFTFASETKKNLLSFQLKKNKLNLQLDCSTRNE